jgi:hypothetical protein
MARIGQPGQDKQNRTRRHQEQKNLNLTAKNKTTRSRWLGRSNRTGQKEQDNQAKIVQAGLPERTGTTGKDRAA